MRSQHTYYTEGYKYRTSESIFKLLEIYPEKEIRSDGKMIILTREGLLFICSGYSSDGPSGPTIDTKSFMLAAFIHDALYELLRQGWFETIRCVDKDGKLLTHEDIRMVADRVLKAVCLEKKMLQIRANWVYAGVRKGGVESATVKRKIFRA